MSKDDVQQPQRAVFFTREFKRNLRQLARKYRHIQSDLQPVLRDLEQGLTPGDRIAGVSAIVYKVRVRNPDSGKGKRGGYRIIYHIQTETQLILITIYSKTEQADITSEDIRTIIDQHIHDQEQDPEA